MATGTIKKGLPLDINIYSIAPNATTTIALGGGFRGFAVITAYIDDLKGLYIIGVNAAGNTTRVETVNAATNITIPTSDTSGNLKVTNANTTNEAKLILFGFNV